MKSFLCRIGWHQWSKWLHTADYRVTYKADGCGRDAKMLERTCCTCGLIQTKLLDNY